MGEFKSGFVAVVGRTNVGKSSIINKLVGEKVSAIANKPQTTRKVIKGIVNSEKSQIVFVDTPGLHHPKSKLGETMVSSAIQAIPDADVVLCVIDATEKDIDNETIVKIQDAKKKTILIINKIDLIDPKRLAEIIMQYKDLYDFAAMIPISTKNDMNVSQIIPEIERNLKPGPAYYSTEEYTDQNLRSIAEETIREKALKLLQDEVPHGILVEVTKLKTRKTENGKKIFDIEATIYCIRESHKGIIIGKQGSMLKKIGTYAREDLEKMLGEKVNLQLWVKVKEDWINDANIVKRFKTTD